MTLKRRDILNDTGDIETPDFNLNSNKMNLTSQDSSPSPIKSKFLIAETPTLKMKKLTDQFRAALDLHKDK